MDLLNDFILQVEESREMNQNLVNTKERLSQEQQTLTEKLESLLADNKYNIHVLIDSQFCLYRNLKTSLLDSERYREEFREISEYIAMLKRRQKELEDMIKRTKEDLNKARMEGVMPKTKYYAPKFNKDTKVIDACNKSKCTVYSIWTYFCGRSILI